MKKRFLLFSIMLLTALFYDTRPASAHVLKTNGSVGAVVHVSPEDDPIAGEPTDFFFEFKDKKGKFTPENCDCAISIQQAGKEIYTQPLFQNNADPSLTNASFSYTFPQRDVYKVIITGKPNTEEAFEPFTLFYDIRVARISEALAAGQVVRTEPKKSNWLTTHIPQLVIGGSLLTLAGIILMKKIRRHPSA